jgi:hypothetical protein
MKTAYKGMSEKEKIETKAECISKIEELKSSRNIRDLKKSELWIEFHDWTLIYNKEYHKKPSILHLQIHVWLVELVTSVVSLIEKVSKKTDR